VLAIAKNCDGDRQLKNASGETLRLKFGPVNAIAWEKLPRRQKPKTAIAQNCNQ
jgi:hypothetical protein